MQLKINLSRAKDIVQVHKAIHKYRHQMSLSGSPSSFIELLKGALLFRLAITPPGIIILLSPQASSTAPYVPLLMEVKSSHEVHTILTEGEAEWGVVTTKTAKFTFSKQITVQCSL